MLTNLGIDLYKALEGSSPIVSSFRAYEHRYPRNYTAAVYPPKISAYFLETRLNTAITFPKKWLTATAMEQAIAYAAPHKSTYCEFCFPSGCKVMIDSAVRLLSLFNQLDLCCIKVLLNFEDGDDGAMGYLNRMGFFEHLSKRIDIKQGWPEHSWAEIHGGTNDSLVEIANINTGNRDTTLCRRLTNALMRPYTSRPDANELSGAAWLIFSELTDNIFEHSETPLDGYAALQSYPGGKQLRVAVSDSGLGIMDTLRPTLVEQYPSLTQKTDIELLVEMFKQGISRHGNDRGMGLKGCAEKAIKYKADLDIRLPESRILLAPSQDGYQPNTLYCSDNIPLIWGTHICFTFRLDK